MDGERRRDPAHQPTEHVARADLDHGVHSKSGEALHGFLPAHGCGHLPREVKERYRGLNVLPIIYPAVPLKAARFRFFITSEHTPDQIRSAVKIMCEVMEESGAKRRAA